MKQSPLARPALLLLAVAIMVASTVVADTMSPPRGSHPEDVNSDFIRQVSVFAVIVYRLAKEVSLTYVSTVWCASTAAGGGGNNYWMMLTATNGTTGRAGNYTATVWGIPGSQSNTWKLLSLIGATSG